MGKHTLRAFDPYEVKVTVLGQPIVGFSDDKVMVERANNAWELVVGADGEATRVKSNDLSGTITITLQQTSPSNNLCSAIFQVDDKLSTGVVPISIQDNSGKTLVVAAKCYVEKMPDATFGKTHNDRVWVFRSNYIEYFLGGNDEADREQSTYTNIKDFNAAASSIGLKVPDSDPKWPYNKGSDPAAP